MKNNDALRLLTILGTLKPEAETKLEKAIESTMDNAMPFVKAYNKKLVDMDIEYCATDEKGHILKDQHGNRVFTKEGQRQLIIATEDFLRADIIIPFEIVNCSDNTGLNPSQTRQLRELSFLK